MVSKLCPTLDTLSNPNPLAGAVVKFPLGNTHTLLSLLDILSMLYAKLATVEERGGKSEREGRPQHCSFTRGH